MLKKLPEEIRETVKKVIASEVEISYAKPEAYNSYVADSDDATAVSASGRLMKGTQEVCGATIAVSHGNVGEHGRFIDWISCDYSGGMAYVVFKSGVSIDKEDNSTDDLCWIITMILRETPGGWRLIHRHNTRSKK